MSKLNVILDKWNFKKIFIGFIIISVIIGILCASGVGYIHRDKISFAIKYESINDKIEDDLSDIEKVKSDLSELSKASSDIADILLLDNNNHILYSTNNLSLAGNETFDLKRDEENKRFLVSDKNKDIAFRFVKKDEFMLSSAFADKFSEVHDEYDEDNFYQSNFTNKKVYLLGLLNNHNSDNKIYIISDAKAVPNGILAIKLAASIMMFLFMLYWIIIALWVYQNARKSHISALPWGIAVLFTNLAGVLVYFIYKSKSDVCKFCGAVQKRGNLFCTNCGKKIGVNCPKCNATVKNDDNFCHNCGHSMKVNK